MRKNPNRWDARVAITKGKMFLLRSFTECIQYCFVDLDMSATVSCFELP
jgi:hypothetical protein